MYRALNYGFVNDTRNGDLVLEGLDYVSNVAPIVNSVETGRMDLDGATAWYTGSAQYSGFYAARTYASMTVANAQADHMYYWVAGQGTTTSVTFYDPTAAATRAEFHWHVSGTSSSTSGTGLADGRIDFSATTRSRPQLAGPVQRRLREHLVGVRHGRLLVFAAHGAAGHADLPALLEQRLRPR